MDSLLDLLWYWKYLVLAILASIATAVAAYVYRQQRGRFLAFALGGGVLCAGALVVSSLWTFVWQKAYEPGQIQEVQVAGSAVHVVDRVTDRSPGSMGTYRLTLLDAASGARKARLVVGEVTRLLGASGGRVWAQGKKSGIHLRDAGTGRVVAREAEVRGRTALLAPGILKTAAADSTLEVHPVTGALRVMTNAGLKAWIDPLTLAASPDAAPPPRASLRARLAGHPRARLWVNGAAVGNAEFLEGQLLAGASPLPEPESYLVAHYASLDAAAKRLRIARVAEDGRVLWEVNEESLGKVRWGRVAHAARAGALVVLGLVGQLPGQDEVVALRAADGAIAWRARF